MAVEWGLAHRDLSEIRSIGVDEVAWQKKGSKFLTVVYQIDGGCRRLLWIGRDRTKAWLNNFLMNLVSGQVYCSLFAATCGVRI